MHFNASFKFHTYQITEVGEAKEDFVNGKELLHRGSVSESERIFLERRRRSHILGEMTDEYCICTQ